MVKVRGQKRRMGQYEMGSERFRQKVLWILRIEANRGEERELGGESRRGNMLASTL